ncbi:hypothetical protein LPJ72_002713 [Coemansia sp. Benny D160-2]|nr:hypothetical protein LPJ72_002713 [Coemansia sp. Benny D160-2]
MAEFRYAYLYKNGEQTSCMVAVVSMTFGIVAANCIDLTNDNKVDTSVKYKIHYSPYNNNTGPMYDISPSGFTVHPNYNPQTLENNIAVLQYTDSTADSYSSYISTNAIGPTNKVYIRRDYNILTSTWTAPELINNDVSDSDCEDTSPMYAANTDYMTCISSTTTSIISSKCSIPYALMYKEKSDDVIALSTIYSHSVIFGDDMCGGSNRILNYYTYLWPYLEFFLKTLNQAIQVYGQNDTAVFTIGESIVMNPPTNASTPASTLVGGDLYPMQRKIEDIPEASAILSDEILSTILESTTSGSISSSGGGGSSSSGGGGSSSNDGNDDADPSLSKLLTEVIPDSTHSSGGLSKGEKIAIGVTVPLGVILVTIGVIIVLHIWKINRQDKAWDPQAETMNLHDIAIEIRADDVNIGPPPYAHVNKSDELIVFHSDTTTDSKK